MRNLTCFKKSTLIAMWLIYYKVLRERVKILRKHQPVDSEYVTIGKFILQVFQFSDIQRIGISLTQ